MKNNLDFIEIISAKENSFLLIEKSNTLFEAISLFNQLEQKPHYFLVKFSKNNYYVYPTHEINQLLTKKQNILQYKILKLKKYFLKTKKIENPKNLDELNQIDSSYKFLLISLFDYEISVVKNNVIKKNSFFPLPKLTKTIFLFFITTMIPLFFNFFEFKQLFLPANEVMNGEWNIAVVEFSISDTNKNKDINSNIITNIFYNRLEKNTINLGDEIDIIYKLSGPNDLSKIKNNDIEFREKKAQEIAKKVNADIVIYGLITNKNNIITIQPEFFISINNHYEAEEMVGHHFLGDPIIVSYSNNIDEFNSKINKILTQRAELLTLITNGLAFYSNSNYEDSLKMFEKANQNKYWNTNKSREVLYLFIGNTYGKLLDIKNAETNFFSAIKNNPEYSRAYIGLGSVYLLSSLQETNYKNFIPNYNDLEQAEKYFNLASIANDKPDSADIQTKVNFGYGQVYQIYFFAGYDKFNISNEYFYQVIDEYNNTKNERIKEITSEAYARLALSYQKNSEEEKSIIFFENAIILAKNPLRKALYNDSIADIYRFRKNLNEEKNYRKRCIDEYQKLIFETESSDIRNIYYIEIINQYLLLADYTNALEVAQSSLLEFEKDSENYLKIENLINKIREGQK